MNIAERTISYYESDDFKSEYAMYLFEDREYCLDQLQIAVRNEIWMNHDGTVKEKWEDSDLERILNYIIENAEDFLDDFCNYYVGDMCISSISFGEQEESLRGINNSDTGKDYTLPYLKRVFDKEGFYIDRNYAYYDMGGDGIKVDLIPEKIPFWKELIKKYTK